MKLCLIAAMVLVTSVAAADSFKVEWNLQTAEGPVKLDQFSHSFKANGMACEVSRSFKMNSTMDGTGLVESRTLTCKTGKKEVLKQEIRCDRKQVTNFLEYGSIYLSCNTK